VSAPPSPVLATVFETKDTHVLTSIRFIFYSKGFDLVSGYRHKPIPEGSNMTLAELRKGGYVLTESQWMTRILFLETIAGVPGFFAAMIRHLKGLRSLVRTTASLLVY